MASNNDLIGIEVSNVAHPRLKLRLGRAKPKKTMTESKRSRTWSSHRFQKLGHPENRSVFFQKPKLYSQASYIGPTDVEPFSTFKGPHVTDGDLDEEGFPTALCRMNGCWQTQPHSHDLPKLLEIEYRGKVPYTPKPHNTNCGGMLNDERDKPSMVGRTPHRPPSPLVAGPACLSERIVEPLLAQSQYRFGKELTKPPFDTPRESHSPPPSSLMSQPALGGTRDLRDALSSSSNGYETSHPRVLQPNAWRVTLPIHRKSSTKRKHESAESLGTGLAPKRQAETSVMRPTAPLKKRIWEDPPRRLEDNRGYEK